MIEPVFIRSGGDYQTVLRVLQACCGGPFDVLCGNCSARIDALDRYEDVRGWWINAPWVVPPA